MSGNGNQRRSRWNQRPTDEQVATLNKIREEKRRVNDQKKAERDQFDSQWPDIRVDYEPNVWREFYHRLHPDALAASKTKIQELEDLSEEEAERKLFDILLKATFIELNLSINGAQNVETLLENLELATENKEEMPFKSTEDLTAFLKSMVPVFKLDVRTKKWRNTGVQTRKCCQFLRERIQLGDLIDDDNFDETYGEFKTTIKSDSPAAQRFAEQEFILDISSYDYLAAIVPGFGYDEESGRLSLKEDVLLLSLHLPILATLLHFNNKKWSDRSRVVTGSVTQYATGYPKLGKCIGVSPTIDGVEVALFRSKMENVNEDTFKQYLNVTSFPFPYIGVRQQEAISVEPTRLDFSKNFVTGTGPVVVGHDGGKKDVNFGNLEHYVEECKKKSTYRKK